MTPPRVDAQAAEKVRETPRELATRLQNREEAAVNMARFYEDRMKATKAELDTARAELVSLKDALGECLDVLVDRWHCSDTDVGQESLAQWMELSDAEYARFVEEGPLGYASVIAAREALGRQGAA